MSEDWNTKYGTRRVRRDPPTLDEAIFAAIGITDDQEAQAEIAASLMGLPIEQVQAEVKKASRVDAGPLDDARDRRRTGRAALGRGRAPHCQEIRQRQAHRDVTNALTKTRTKNSCAFVGSNAPFMPPGASRTFPAICSTRRG